MTMKENSQMKDKRIVPGQDWRVERFRPEDAEGVCALFRSVYGAGYPVRAYIEPDLLRAENAAGRIISSVARTPQGDIVGHNALFQSAPYKKIYETGAGVVHADYRGGHGIFTDMVAHGLALGRRQPEIELIYGESVCNHVFTQKLCHKLGFVNRALEADLMPAAAYSKEKSAAGRVSTVLGFIILQSYPHTVYLPSLYVEQLSYLYKNLEDQRVFRVADQPLPAGLATRLKSEIFTFAGVARIAVAEIGDDFAEVLQDEERRLLKAGIEVFQVWLKAAGPAVGSAAAILHEEGYFLGGVLPRWFNEDGLLMQKIKGKPNWDGIQTCFASDRELVELVQADWRRTTGR
ncbi:MAG: hypothetical protein JXR89_07640 [Deltaproteobacteria bacterium]|nr:hypothetical protein [Deltaproteobacteria bacterium]